MLIQPGNSNNLNIFLHVPLQWHSCVKLIQSILSFFLTNSKYFVLINHIKSPKQCINVCGCKLTKCRIQFYSPNIKRRLIERCVPVKFGLAVFLKTGRLVLQFLPLRAGAGGGVSGRRDVLSWTYGQIPGYASVSPLHPEPQHPRELDGGVCAHPLRPGQHLPGGGSRASIWEL